MLVLLLKLSYFTLIEKYLDYINLWCLKCCQNLRPKRFNYDARLSVNISVRTFISKAFMLTMQLHPTVLPKEIRNTWIEQKPFTLTYTSLLTAFLLLRHFSDLPIIKAHGAICYIALELIATATAFAKGHMQQVPRVPGPFSFPLPCACHPKLVPGQ